MTGVQTCALPISPTSHHLGKPTVAEAQRFVDESEARLDKLMEFMSRIPSSMKRSGQEGKIILKEAVGSLLPPATLRKTKTGFGLPVSSWLRQGLKPLMRSMLLDAVACRRGIFDPHFVRTMVDEHLDSKRDWGYRLWSLLMLEMWFREFID